MSRALYESLQFVRANKKETVEIFSRWLKIDPAIAADTYELAVKTLSTDGLMSDEKRLAAIEIFSDNPKEMENVALTNAVDFSLPESGNQRVSEEKLMGGKMGGDDFRDFVHTGPGTPAGRFMRTFWQPVCVAKELEPRNCKTDPRDERGLYSVPRREWKALCGGGRKFST